MARLLRAAGDRRPHLLLACLVVGLGVAVYGPIWSAAAACAVMVVGAFGGGWRLAALASALVVAGAGFGALRIAAIDRPARAAPVGAILDATATLLERPRAGAHGSSAPMRIESGPAAGLRVLGRRRESWWPAVDPGTRFRLRGLVRPPNTTSGPVTSLYGIRITEANAGRPGAPGFGPLPARSDPADDFDYAAFLRSRGIGRELTVLSLRRVGHRGGLLGGIDAIRRRAEAGISDHLSRNRAALARGMVLGEDGDIAADTRDDFRRAGLAHLLAASGQNVALLCALVLPILIVAGVAARTRAVVLLPVVGLYVALAGSGASVLRAGIMAAASLIALLASRRASAAYALLLAAAVTLALNPRASGDPGWQLSFAAVIGMLVFGSPIQKRLRGLPRPAAEAVGATAAATLATAPLLAHDFGAISMVALPANLVAFPAVVPIMWIGMGEAALAQIGGLGGPFAAAAHLLDRPLAAISSLALHWVEVVGQWFSDRSWAQAHFQIGWTVVLLGYALLAAGVLAARRASVRRATTAWLGDAHDWLRSLSPASRRALAAPLAALALGAVAHASQPRRPPQSLTVDFIDVGQGDSTLIRDPTGATVLFDGGVPEARVDRTLKHLGVSRLSVVVATHQSRDHHGGLLQVVRRFPVGLFLDGRYGVRDASFEALEHEVDGRHIPRRPVVRGEQLHVGQLTIHVLWPPPRGNAPPPADPNTRAAVAIVSAGDFKLFLSADAEAPVLLPLDLPRVTAMKVPHHGSAEAGLPQLLRRLQPKVAAIECGRGNPFAHPRPSTLAALRRVPRVYRTDRDGTIELTVGRGRIAIRTHR
jgi:competence protein ComEC